jgi:protein-S-isoprenylcysteine O-methyltransferase Ste14
MAGVEDMTCEEAAPAPEFDDQTVAFAHRLEDRRPTWHDGPMRKTRAATGSIVFFLLAPGVVAGVIPWWLTDREVRDALPVALRVLGAALVAAGAVVLVQTFARFVREGLGTPAPVAPTETLVVGGLYRHVRNPMYLAVLATIVGQALWFGQPILLGYAALVWVVVASFVRFYEEPHLTGRFGADYSAYRAAVPAWIPLLRPWNAGEDTVR